MSDLDGRIQDQLKELTDLTRDNVNAIRDLTSAIKAKVWGSNDKNNSWQTLALFCTLLLALGTITFKSIESNKEALNYMVENDSAAVQVLQARQESLGLITIALDAKLQLEIDSIEKASSERHTQQREDIIAAERRSAERHTEQSLEMTLRIRPLMESIKRLEDAIGSVSILERIDRLHEK